MKNIFPHFGGPVWLAVAAAVCLALCSACSDDEEETAPADETDPVEEEVYVPERTVIVYMCGENNLGTNLSSDSASYVSYLSVDLSEMVYGSFFLPADSCHLVVYVDDSSGSMPYIAEIKQGYMVKDTGLTFDEDIISTDPEQMESILAYIMNAYEAKSYGLVLWGHADGWLVTNDTISVETSVEAASRAKRKAYGVDNNRNASTTSGYWINIPTLADILEALPQTFKFIFADCCQFQCIESMYELRNAAEYIIGSPAEIPAVGAPYDYILPYLFSTSDEFYKGIVDAYNTGSTLESYGGEAYTLPLSVVKTEGLEALASATCDILPALLSDTFSVSTVIYYSSLPYSSTARIAVMYDMKDLMMQNASTSDYYEAWLEAFTDVVVYGLPSDYWMTAGYVQFSSKRFSATQDNYGGVSMFLPSRNYDVSNTPSPNETIKQFEWFSAAGLEQLGFW